jgi:hypothetical protein
MPSTNLILNKSEMTMLIRVMNPPALTPCNARPVMSIAMVVETAHTIELAKYRPTLISRIGFLPQMSESFAQIGLQADVAMTYAAPIQE